MPISTGTSGFARILRISPRLPLSPSTTSVDRNAEACPTTHRSFSLFLRTSVSHRISGCLDVSSNVSATSVSRVERSPTHRIIFSHHERRTNQGMLFCIEHGPIFSPQSRLSPGSPSCFHLSASPF